MPDASKVRVAITGAIFKAPMATAAPTGTASATTAYTDLGYVNEDGVTVEIPAAGESTPIKAWQNGVTVRVIRTPSEDNPTWQFVLLESNKAVIETAFGVVITSGSTEGSFEYQVTNRDPFRYLIDYIDGAALTRDFVPRGVVTEVEAIVHKGTEDPIQYGITIEGERDTVLGYNFKRWSTDLKT